MTTHHISAILQPLATDETLNHEDSTTPPSSSPAPIAASAWPSPAKRSPAARARSTPACATHRSSRWPASRPSGSTSPAPRTWPQRHSRCSDVTLLINNAGIAAVGGFLSADSIESARAQLETNFFGPLRMSQAFAPVLAANGGGAILNVLSVASWINSPMLADVWRQQVGRLGADQRPAPRAARAGHAGAGHARGLRRYRPDTRHRPAQVDARS